MSILYEAQRAMRRARKVALQRGVIAILDVGTFKTVCLVLRFEPESDFSDDGMSSMAGQARFRVIGAATTRSRGVRFGEIATMAETERALRTALQAAQKMADVRVDHVIACFSGGRPRSYGLTSHVNLSGDIVDEHDIARLLAACEMPHLPSNVQVLHAQPVNFTIDHRTGLRDPRGQVGNTLAADLHMLSVDDHTIDHLVYCVKRCDVELAGISSAAYVSGMSALVEDEQELGAACIDMGGGATSISLFMRMHMIYADTIRMGGEHITSDISQGLQIPMQLAERIKTRFGGVLATGLDDRELIDLAGDTGDWEHDRRQITRSELIGIIRPRVEEILEEVRMVLDDAGFSYLPSQRIVLTGGASQIPGLDGLAARILGNQVRLGRPLRIKGLPQAVTGPAFSAAVGLCMSVAEPQDEWWDFDTTSYPAYQRSTQRMLRWFKNNW